jgi:conjugal transfer pilus assembly protein TraV
MNGSLRITRSPWPAFPASIFGACALAGCSNLTGLDGTDQYACRAPEGIHCESVSGTYHNALQSNLPSQRMRHDATARGREPAAAPSVQRRVTASTTTPPPAVVSAPRGVDLAALRSQPKVLRLWVKPWEDSDRDLHDQSYVYVQVDAGQWLVERAQRQVRDAYARVRPARAPAEPPGVALTATPAAPSVAAPGDAGTPMDVDSTPTALRVPGAAQPPSSGTQAQE